MTEARIWIAKLHAKELLDCGFDPHSADQGWGVIKGIMRAKGLPDWCMEDRTPVKIGVEAEMIRLEFNG